MTDSTGPTMGGTAVYARAGFCLAFVALAIYAAGACPRCIRYWDVYSPLYQVLGSINMKGFQPTLKTTKFGGTMLLTAAIIATALCTDVLVEYVNEYGVDRSWSTPAIDEQALVTTNARIDLSLSVLRSPVQPTAPCAITQLNSNAALVGGFSLVSQSQSNAPIDANSSALCSFYIVSQSLTVAMSPYAAPPVPGTLTVSLGSFLQVYGWSIKIADAKPSAYTIGQPNAR